MLDRGLNVLGENQGLLFILTIKEKSIEEVLEGYVKVGILTRILNRQISEEGLKEILQRRDASVTSESCGNRYEETNEGKVPSVLGTINEEKGVKDTAERQPSAAYSDQLCRSSSDENGHEPVSKVSLISSQSSKCIPEKIPSSSNALSSSLLEVISDSRCDLSSASTCSSVSLPSDIETFNGLASIDQEYVFKGRNRSIGHQSASFVAVDDSNSATSVYYDAVQSFSDSNINLASADDKADYSGELAKRLVDGAILNALKIAQYDTKLASSTSDLNDNYRPDKSLDEINLAQSEINIERQRDSYRPRVHFASYSLREDHRSWLSASQPICSPRETDQWQIREARTSQSSPIHIPKAQEPNQNMDTQNEPTSINGAEHDQSGTLQNTGAKDVKFEKLFVRNVNYKTSQSKLWSFFSNFGDVKYANVVRDYKTKKSKGYGYVQFRLRADAKKVLSMPQHDLFLDDRELMCSPARSKSEIDQLRYEERSKALQSEADSIAPNSSSSSEYQSVGSDVSSPVQGSEQHPAGDNYTETLTDDMLLQIFSYLNVRERISYERVCKRWQAVLVRSWMSVKKISFENTVRRFGGMSDMKFQKIMKRTRTVRNLDISHVTKMLSDRAAGIIGLYCSHVTDLDISGLPIKNKSLKELADKCTDLQSVKLNNCYSVPEKGLWSLLHQCKSLKHIEIENNKKITGQCFHLLSPNVESICLSECSMVADGAIQRLGDRSHYLTELHLDHCRELTSSAIETIGKNCRMLTKLHLRGNFPKIESQGLVWLSRLHQLEELHMSENLAVADSTLHALSKGCPQLRILDVTSCHRSVTDAGLQDLTKCTNLEELYISYLHKVHDEGLEHIAISCNLKTLEAKGCGGITNAVMATLAQHCQLEFVDISGNTQLSIASVNSFAEALTSREKVKPLTMIIGGINTAGNELPSHPHLNISQRNTCQKHLRQDLDLHFDLDLEDSDYEDEFDDFNDLDGLIVGDDWVVSEGAVQDLLENDDPLAMEEFEMS